MWIKLHDTFLDHRKVRRTARSLSVIEAQVRGHLVTLWLSVLRHKPTGKLDGWDEVDLAEFSGWVDDEHEWANVLVSEGWVVRDSDGFAINDWQEHNELLKAAKVREQNRDRQRRYREKKSNALVTRDVTPANALQVVQSPDVLEVFAHYRGYHPRAHKTPHSKQKEWGKIKARLAEGYSVDDLKLAIDGCHRSPFHMGENDNGRKYNTLELIVRDGSKVQSFIELAQQEGPVLAQKTSKTIRAAQAWAGKET